MEIDEGVEVEVYSVTSGGNGLKQRRVKGQFLSILLWTPEPELLLSNNQLRFPRPRSPLVAQSAALFTPNFRPISRHPPYISHESHLDLTLILNLTSSQNTGQVCTNYSYHKTKQRKFVAHSTPCRTSSNPKPRLRGGNGIPRFPSRVFCY